MFSRKCTNNVRIIVAVALALVAAVVILFILCGNKVWLKYSWGTDFDVVLRKEGDSVRRSYLDRYEFDLIESYDEKHSVDRLKEIDTGGCGVRYTFRDAKLLRVEYSFSNDHSVEETIRIVSRVYGDKYYHRGTQYIWWRNGTIVRLDLYDNSISYRDEIDYLEASDSAAEKNATKDILEYFGKERYDK